MQKIKLQIIIICLSIFSFFSTKAQYNRGAGEAYFNDFYATSTVAEAEFMWIGTAGEGLYKYDTKNNSYTWFNTFNSEIPTNNISDVKIDKSGSLWLATDLGLVLFDKKQWTLYSSIMATTIAIDNNNKVWVGTNSKGVYSINNAEIKQFDKTNSLTSIESIAQIVVDGNNKKWFSTSKGIVSFDEKSWVALETITNSKAPIAVDKQNNLWISNNTSLYKYDGKSTTFIQLQDSGNPSNNYSAIRNIFIDESNTLFISAGLGYSDYLLKYTNGKFEKLLGSFTPYLYILGVDKNNSIWISNPDGIQKLTNNVFQPNDFPTNILKLSIDQSFAIDKNDQTWAVGANENLIYTQGSTWKSIKIPSSITSGEFWGSLKIDSQNNKWFSCAYGLIKFDGNNWNLYSNFKSSISSIGIDKNNTIWVGTDDGKIQSYDGKSWTDLSTKVTNFPTFKYGIQKIVSDNDDNIWMAGDNLLKYNLKTSILTIYSSFYFDNTYDIVVDNDGTVWVKNHFGIQKYKNDKWTQFDSLQGDEVAIDTKNNIWIPISDFYFTKSDLSVLQSSGVLKNTFNNWHSYTSDMKFDSKNNLWYSNNSTSPSRLIKLTGGNEKITVNSSSTNKVIGVDENTSFQIKITGNNLSLQWQVNKGSVWEDLKNGKYTEFTVVGEKTNLLGLTKCSISANNYKFRCKVTDDNTKEIIYSTPVNLAIYGVFAITNQLENKEIFESESITYNVTTAGRNNVNYQWQVKRSTKFENLTPNDKEFIVKGEKTADLTLSGVKLIANNLTVRCLANSLTDTLITNSSKITVKEIFAISQSPQSSSILEGGTANFEITTSKDTLSYLWQYKNSNNWVNLSSTTNNYSVEGLDTKKITLKKVGFAANGLTVRCIVSNKYKYQLTSGEAILTVNKILANEEPNEFSIFPNPVTQPYLNITDINNVKSYSLINSQGMEILSGEVSSNVLQIGNLKNGIYILQLKDKKGIVFSKKLIISQ